MARLMFRLRTYVLLTSLVGVVTTLLRGDKEGWVCCVGEGRDDVIFVPYRHALLYVVGYSGASTYYICYV